VTLITGAREHRIRIFCLSFLHSNIRKCILIKKLGQKRTAVASTASRQLIIGQCTQKTPPTERGTPVVQAHQSIDEQPDPGPYNASKTPQVPRRNRLAPRASWPRDAIRMRKIQLQSVEISPSFPFSPSGVCDQFCARLVLASRSNQVVSSFRSGHVSRFPVVLVPIETPLAVAPKWSSSADGLVEQERFAHVLDFRNRAAQVESF
jgi:hypothetical protein